MPNWCHNRLTVEGDGKITTIFKEKVGDEGVPLSLNSLYAVPDKLKGLVAEVGEPSEYEWCVNHWGTKWDVAGSVLKVAAGGLLEYEFWSAWSPPVSWLQKVSQDYPTLTFTLSFVEPQMGLSGIAQARQGKVSCREI